MSRKEIKVFIVSPNDVQSERMLAKEVCESLNVRISDVFEVVPIIWEDHPLTYTKNPQESIDYLLETSDIYIVILWHRLGTAVEGCVGAITGEWNVTGTQYEIEKILSMGKERILFYIKKEEPLFRSNELEEALNQKRLLERFLDVMELKKGMTKHGYREFQLVSEFKEMFIKHLSSEIENITGERLKPEKKGNGGSHRIQFLWAIGTIVLFVILYYTTYTLPSDKVSNSTNIAVTKKDIGKQKVLNVSDKNGVVLPVNKKAIKKNSINQMIDYILVTVKSVKRRDDGISIILSFASTRKKVGASVAIYAEGSDNIADFWKFFPRPKLAELSDEQGHSYRFKNSTMKYAKTMNDWTTIQPNSEQIIQFTFQKNRKFKFGKKLTLSLLIRTATMGKNGKPRLSSATLYLENLVAN